MNEHYVYAWRRRKVWFTKATVIGHNYDKDQNKMILYLPGGGIREIAHWSDCECKLGVDWVGAQAAQIKKEAGQTPI